MAARTSSSTLVALYGELLDHVMSFLRPNDLLEFGLASQGCYEVVRQSLQAHREYHQQYKTQHDRDRYNVPNLLRLALAQPEKTWHVRCLELWYYRSGSGRWNELQLDVTKERSEHDELEELGSSPLPLFTMDELNSLETTLTEILLFLDGRSKCLVTNVEEGSDHPLKLALLALLPKLDRLCFVEGPTESDDFGSRPLRLFAECIRNINAKLPTYSWPLGFQTLRCVTVGAVYHSRICEATSSDMRIPPFDIAQLFKLPNIKVLNLRCIEPDTGNRPDARLERVELAPKSSSVEELNIAMFLMPIQATKLFLAAPKNLKRLTFEIENDDLEEQQEDLCSIRRVLMENHADCLESFFSATNDYHIFNDYDLNDFASQFSKCTIHEHLKLGGSLLERPNIIPKRLKFRPSIQFEGGRLSLPDLRTVMPTTLEELRFNEWHEHMGLKDRKRYPDAAEFFAFRLELLHAIADMSEEPRFSGLKLVCLNRFYQSPNPFDRLSKIAWGRLELTKAETDAIRRIQARGVRTHLETLLDRDDFHHRCECYRLEDLTFPAGFHPESAPRVLSGRRANEGPPELQRTDLNGVPYGIRPIQTSTSLSVKQSRALVMSEIPMPPTIE